MDDAFDLPSERSCAFFLSIRGVISFAFCGAGGMSLFESAFPCAHCEEA